MQLSELTEITTTPSKCFDTISYKSSDKKIATIDAKGNITAVSGGIATITATVSNGKSASIKIYVVGDENWDSFEDNEDGFFVDYDELERFYYGYTDDE